MAANTNTKLIHISNSSSTLGTYAQSSIALVYHPSIELFPIAQLLWLLTTHLPAHQHPRQRRPSWSLRNPRVVRTIRDETRPFEIHLVYIMRRPIDVIRSSRPARWYVVVLLYVWHQWCSDPAEVTARPRKRMCTVNGDSVECWKRTKVFVVEAQMTGQSGRVYRGGTQMLV